MIEITTTRRPGAKIALAVLNTGHPGPMPRGILHLVTGVLFTSSYAH